MFGSGTIRNLLDLSANGLRRYAKFQCGLAEAARIGGSDECGNTAKPVRPVTRHTDTASAMDFAELF
jgi:hypothetical protein